MMLDDGPVVPAECDAEGRHLRAGDGAPQPQTQSGPDMPLPGKLVLSRNWFSVGTGSQ